QKNSPGYLSLPSQETKQPKCLHTGENAWISPLSSLNTHAVRFTLDSYHPSTCSTSQSTRCGSSVISSTERLTFVNPPESDAVCKTGSTANRNIGTSIPAAINPPNPVKE